MRPPEWTVQTPLIHLNGSGRENLAKQYEAALDAVRNAIDKMISVTPHMRDYYPLTNGEEAYKRAQTEHAERLKALYDIKYELAALMLSVMEEGNGKPVNVAD